MSSFYQKWNPAMVQLSKSAPTDEKLGKLRITLNQIVGSALLQRACDATSAEQASLWDAATGCDEAVKEAQISTSKGLFYLIGGHPVYAGLNDIHPDYVKYILDYIMEYGLPVTDHLIYRHPLLHEISHQAGCEPGYLNPRKDRENSIFKILWSHPLMKMSPVLTAARQRLCSEIADRRQHWWNGEMETWVQTELGIKTAWYPWDTPSNIRDVRSMYGVNIEHYDASDSKSIWTRVYSNFANKCEYHVYPVLSEDALNTILSKVCGCEFNGFSPDLPFCDQITDDTCLHTKMDKRKWESALQQARDEAYTQSDSYKRHRRKEERRLKKLEKKRLRKASSTAATSASSSTTKLTSKNYMNQGVVAVLKHSCYSSGKCVGICCGKGDSISSATATKFMNQLASLNQDKDIGTALSKTNASTMKLTHNAIPEEDTSSWEVLSGGGSGAGGAVALATCTTENIHTIPPPRMEKSKHVIDKHPTVAHAMVERRSGLSAEEEKKMVAKHITCSLCCSESVAEWGMRYSMKYGVKCSVCYTDLGDMLANIDAKRAEFSDRAGWTTFVYETPKEELYKMFCS